MTNIEDLKKSSANGNKDDKQSDTKTKSWRFSNSENKTELERN